MKSIKNILYKLIADKKIAPKDAMMVFKEIEANEKYLSDDIAVIGMSARLPRAGNLKEFWYNLKNSVNCISPLSQDRKNDIGTLFTDEEKKNIIYRLGGYINEIDKFDPSFFKISRKEAKYMEPEQRLFLEVVWEAIEDAGYANIISGTKTGTYVGHDHVTGAVYKNYSGGLASSDMRALTGTYPSILASRISYILDLKGPSIVTDTACSSGLVAVHQACKAIKSNECDMAIAGGIGLQLWPIKYKSFKVIETDNSIVRTFDKNSKGTVWGEGVCTIILKPLKKALRDRDNIHAVIKGSAINNDGISSGITAPNASAQADVIVKAWEEAKINPETISYIETHCTGTVMGDPIEVKALTNAFSRFTKKKQFCGIGSLKPSVGHLVSASGTASLLKIILSMKNKKIPATINFQVPNPYISFHNSPVYINDKIQNWEVKDHPRRAGVNCFGFSGTNCHMVLEEAPEVHDNIAEEEIRPCILVISAKSEDILENMVKQYSEYLDNSKAKLEDICYTASTGRKHYEYRLALTVSSKSELKKKLDIVCCSDFQTTDINGIYYGFHRIVNKYKEERKKGELTEGEKERLTNDANTELKAMLQNKEKHSKILDEVCSYYIQGADMDWESILYVGEERRRVSIPVYSFKKKRYWYFSDLSKKYGDDSRSLDNRGLYRVEHPLLDYCASDTITNTTYVTELCQEKYWILTEHKLLGESIVPETAYFEMIQEVCSSSYDINQMEIRDVAFFSPILVNKGEKKKIYTEIRRSDEYLEFIICSKDNDRWVKHVQGKGFDISIREEKVYDVEDIKNRCNKEIKESEIKDKTAIAEFGPRWKNVSEALSGNNEMLVKIQLPQEMIGDLKEYCIHPAMLDNAVNMFIRLNESNDYRPFSYKSFRIYDKMPSIFYSYIKTKGNLNDDSETFSFDIVLIDENGNRFIEIDDYVIKKGHK
ncbi:MAG: polyketide synthase dehydratase domain-containing protein [Clostridia bacterium]|nr:polyketide synthase dehydratase domain-containing protein [Clostridia bacterium]